MKVRVTTLKVIILMHCQDKVLLFTKIYFQKMLVALAVIQVVYMEKMRFSCYFLNKYLSFVYKKFCVLLVSVVPFKKTYQDLFRQCGVTENVTIKNTDKSSNGKGKTGYYPIISPMYQCISACIMYLSMYLIMYLLMLLIDSNSFFVSTFTSTPYI
jgi:hypothetical protein